MVEAIVYDYSKLLGRIKEKIRNKRKFSEGNNNIIYIIKFKIKQQIKI